MSIQHICRRAGNRQSYYAWFQAMHTRIDLLFVADKSEDDFNRVAARAQQLIADIEAVGNCFGNDSELSRLNRHEIGIPIQVSDMLYDLLSRCKEYTLSTFGLFDVTVESAEHDTAAIDSIILSENNTVTLTRAGVYINMSGILKGYALDRLRMMLEHEAVADAFMSLGNSSIMAMGAKSGCDGWPVGEQFGEQCFETSLHNECLTTSGNIDGVNHHIINPLTNKEIGVNCKASVVTRSATEGEVLSTAYLIADDEQRARLDSIFQPRCVVVDGEVHYNL